VAVADLDAAAAREVAERHGAQVVPPEELLSSYEGLDGVVIATPNALHAEQARAVLGRGLAVFCQKPLARTRQECEEVVEAARRADRLLGVDLSYRHLAAVRAVEELVRDGSLGEVYAADLVFHNAYGPDKAWFTDPALAGGGCVLDLGIHLVDLVLHLLDRPKVEGVSSRLYAHGRPPQPGEVEDFATARLDLSTGASVTMACSWFLHAGADAEISLTLLGTRGAATVRNVQGSFYDFVAEHRTGTTARTLVEPPDDWGGRAVAAWSQQLDRSPRFDPAVAEVVEVAGVLDRVYGR
jgi:predicted dehydrogenase